MSHEPGGPIPRCDCYGCSGDSELCKVPNLLLREDHQRFSLPQKQLALRTSPFECNRTPYKRNIQVNINTMYYF